MTATELMEECEPLLISLAVEMGVAKEDFTMESWQAAEYALATFDPERGTIHGYYKRVVRNEWINTLRKEQRIREREQPTEDMRRFETEDDTVNVEAEATSNVDLISLLAKVTNEVSRDLVWKVLAEGWSQLEAAEHYGISQQTASRRIAEAMSEIRGV